MVKRIVRGTDTKERSAGAHAEPPHPAKASRVPLEAEASYTCASCGAINVVVVDETAGGEQSFYEDCENCCHAHLVRVHLDEDGQVSLSAEASQ